MADALHCEQIRSCCEGGDSYAGWHAVAQKLMQTVMKDEHEKCIHLTTTHNPYIFLSGALNTFLQRRPFRSRKKWFFCVQRPRFPVPRIGASCELEHLHFHMPNILVGSAEVIQYPKGESLPPYYGRCLAPDLFLFRKGVLNKTIGVGHGTEQPTFNGRSRFSIV